MCHHTEQCSLYCYVERRGSQERDALTCLRGAAPGDAPSDRPGGLIGAVDNVLRLLRLFEDHEMIRVNQVARDMGLSRSTVHRMLATLSHHQFVEQDEYSRAYKPGPALVDIGLSVVSKIDIRDVSHSALVDLRDLTGETAHLGIMRGAASVLYLDSVESDRVVRTGSRIGRDLARPRHRQRQGAARGAHRRGDRRPVPVRRAAGADAARADHASRNCSSSSPRSAAWATRSTTGKARTTSPRWPPRSATSAATSAVSWWSPRPCRAPTTPG